LQNDGFSPDEFVRVEKRKLTSDQAFEFERELITFFREKGALLFNKGGWSCYRSGAINVWEQRLAGGEPRRVTNFSSGQIFDFSWTQDGKQLLLAKGERTGDVVLISNFH